MTDESKRANYQVGIDDEETLVNAVFDALQPICRDPTDPAKFDGNRATDTLGACAGLIFAGIPEPHRERVLNDWCVFVRKCANNIEVGKSHTLKIMGRA